MTDGPSLGTPVVPEDSALRQPPKDLSRRQVLILDGIRYAVEMADVAYGRLYESLAGIARSSAQPTTRDIAAVMLDAWSVIDAVHRFVDLVGAMPGLPQGPWFRGLRQRCAVALELRDRVQHQNERAAELAEKGGPIWGYVSWAEVDDGGNHTGRWLMISPGSEYVGDEWLFIGPGRLPFLVPRGRVRLTAFGRQVYLGRCVQVVLQAARHIDKELRHGHVRCIGVPASDRRGADTVMEGFLEVLVARTHG